MPDHWFSLAGRLPFRQNWVQMKKFLTTGNWHGLSDRRIKAEKIWLTRTIKTQFMFT